MSYQTMSAIPLDAVLVEAKADGMTADVWLRKNIEKDVADQGEDAGNAIEFYKADEVHFVAVGVPTVDEVTAAFDALWTAHEQDGLTDGERIAILCEQLDKTNAALDDATAALLELGDLVGGE
jgi:hypothetical protein